MYFLIMWRLEWEFPSWNSFPTNGIVLNKVPQRQPDKMEKMIDFVFNNPFDSRLVASEANLSKAGLSPAYLEDMLVPIEAAELVAKNTQRSLASEKVIPPKGQLLVVALLCQFTGHDGENSKSKYIPNWPIQNNSLLQDRSTSEHLVRACSLPRFWEFIKVDNPANVMLTGY
ncbi:hypothetical protein ACH5RR_003127 [Cinchona calisaya]|uniref:Uncharacterized protein n=1 Tax=Cinchona calisaya TaxID=153742 RepID=A0ABD3AUA2_9GENT